MKLFRRMFALTMVLALLLSMSLTVLAADIATADEFYTQYGAGETTFNLVDNITAKIEFEAKEDTSYTFGSEDGYTMNMVVVHGSGSVAVDTGIENYLYVGDTANVTVSKDVNTSVLVDDNATANITENVNGNLAVSDQATVSVGGDVNGNLRVTDDVDQNNTAKVTVEGNVNGELEANGYAEVTVGGNVDGYLVADDDAEVTVAGNANNGLDAYDNAEVTVGGDVNDYLFAGDDAEVTVGGNVDGYVEAIEDAQVTVDGDVDGTLRAMDHAQVSVEGNLNNSLFAQATATITVAGNVTGSAQGGVGFPALVIAAVPADEKLGSITVQGDVRSGKVTGENQQQYPDIYIGVDEGITGLPSITVGSYETIGGENMRNAEPMTDEELEAIKATIKTTSKGESKQAPDIFWPNLIAKIRKANPGDEITINVYGRKSIPASVIEAVRQYDVKLIIKWNGGDDLVITKDFTAEVKGDILLKDLAEMLKK